MTIKQVAVFGAALALLGGCASAPEQKPVEPAPAPAPVAAPVEAPKPVVAPAPAPAPMPPKIATIKGTGYFDFNKSELRADTKAALDKEIVAKKDDVKSVSSVVINGHADRLGSHEYNQKLSEKRAEVAKAYLVGQGVPANSVDTIGFGKTQPAQGVAKCEDSLGRKKLIECLQPHRRVEVELKGEAK
jgi:OOP family OmpA-OmpF porin